GLDVAVRIGVLAESSAVATRVGAVRHIVVASPTYLAQHGIPQTPADLGVHAVVAFSGVGGGGRWIFCNETRETSVAIRPRLIVTTAEAALDVVRADFGITRVLSYQAADDIARGSLLRLLPAHEGLELPIHLLYPGGRHPPPKLRAFLDFAKPRLRRRCEAIMRALNSCGAVLDGRRTSGPEPSSPILPGRLALLDEGGNALLGVARHHIFHHHFGRVVVGVGDAHFQLAVECLLAELH